MKRRHAYATSVRYDDWTPSPTNILVDALYEACGDKHVSSGQLVERGDTAPRWMAVCARWRSTPAGSPQRKRSGTG